jgi:hypothetical protein
MRLSGVAMSDRLNGIFPTYFAHPAPYCLLMWRKGLQRCLAAASYDMTLKMATWRVYKNTYELLVPENFIIIITYAIL